MVEMTFGTWNLLRYYASFIILLVCTTIKLTFNNISRFFILALPVVSSSLIHNLVSLCNNKTHQTILAALLFKPCQRHPTPAAIRPQLATLRPLPAT
jgi:hypothetical protein